MVDDQNAASNGTAAGTATDQSAVPAEDATSASAPKQRRRRAASRPAGPPAATVLVPEGVEGAGAPPDPSGQEGAAAGAPASPEDAASNGAAPAAVRTTRRRSSRPRPARASAAEAPAQEPPAEDAAAVREASAPAGQDTGQAQAETLAAGSAQDGAAKDGAAQDGAAQDKAVTRRRRTRRSAPARGPEETAGQTASEIPAGPAEGESAASPVEPTSVSGDVTAPVPVVPGEDGVGAPAPEPVTQGGTRTRTRRRTRATKAEAVVAVAPDEGAATETAGVPAVPEASPEEAPAAATVSSSTEPSSTEPSSTVPSSTEPSSTDVFADRTQGAQPSRRRAPLGTTAVLFQPPTPPTEAPRRRAATRPAGPPRFLGDDPEPLADEDPADAQDRAPEAPRQSGDTAGRGRVEAEPQDADVDEDGELLDEESEDGADDSEPSESRRRRRRRGGRGRRGRNRGTAEDGSGDDPADEEPEDEDPESDTATEEAPEEDAEADLGTGSSRRRRRRRRRGSAGDTDAAPDDPPNTVVRVREPRRGGSSEDVSSIKGSTRLEAKKQRRREGREAGRRRTVITEAEFLARRESVDRVMAVRERNGRTQIAVLEDGVLVEHYVARHSQVSMVGNVYLGKVQNVLPSMEAAFIDIGKGRNAVLYAGEVNWDAAGMEGQPRRIEHALKSGESVLVQVTKDPIGHKGARLTSQISLPGRYLVYVPDGSMTGISRKLPDTERTRLKRVLRQIVPDDAGVIVRTAAEGATEDELSRDVTRLRAQWEDITRKAGAVNAPALLYGEPDLAIRVVRDIFNEDFARLLVSGGEAWDTLSSYIGHVAPDLVSRLEKWTDDQDLFAAHRVDEQLAKGLERKVWLPSGGSLIIDRTEAMSVIDVNTGKFTGTGGNLEETVTRNNIEAAEEIVRQLRLRDIGGIIVVDFIDMVLESNRELVLRRLLECLGRDRTKHQVAEVTSLGLVQMTRKRVGQGLLEAFSETCDQCSGRGLILHEDPVEKRAPAQEGSRSSGGRSRSSRSQGGGGGKGSSGAQASGDAE